MPIKSIIIDDKTEAKRISSDKVQLDLVATSLDDKNNAEPSADFRLYINNELLQNLKSNAKGDVRETIIIDYENQKTLSVKLEATITGISSEIEYIIDSIKKELDPKKAEQIEEKINVIKEKRKKLEDEEKQIEKKEKKQKEEIDAIEHIINKIKEDIEDVNHTLKINNEKKRRNNENNIDQVEKKKREKELIIKEYELWIKYYEKNIEQGKKQIEIIKSRIVRNQFHISKQKIWEEIGNLWIEEYQTKRFYYQEEDDIEIKKNIDNEYKMIRKNQESMKDGEKLIREYNRDIESYKDHIEEYQEHIQKYKSLIQEIQKDELKTQEAIGDRQEDRKKEKEKIIAKIKLSPNQISGAPERARNDEEIMKLVLEQDGNLLCYGGENIKNDKEMVIIALKNSINAFIYMSDILKTDESFILECLGKFGEDIFDYIPQYMRNTHKIKTWIDTYKKRKNELVVKRLNNYNNQQELNTLTSQTPSLQRDVDKAQKELDCFPQFSSLLNELKGLYQEREDNFRKRSTKLHYNMKKREIEEDKRIHEYMKELEIKWTQILREIKKIPIFTYGIERSTIDAKRNIDNYLSMKNTLIAQLSDIQKKLKENTDRINEINNNTGRTIDFDEEIKNLHTKIRV